MKIPSEEFHSISVFKGKRRDGRTYLNFYNQLPRKNRVERNEKYSEVLECVKSVEDLPSSGRWCVMIINHEELIYNRFGIGMSDQYGYYYIAFDAKDREIIVDHVSINTSWYYFPSAEQMITPTTVVIRVDV